MQTAVEFSDDLWQRAKMAAQSRGQTIQAFVAAAVQEKLAAPMVASLPQGNAPWMRLAGALRDYTDDLRMAEAAVEEAFEQIEDDEPT